MIKKLKDILDNNNKIHIPDFAKRVKIDIGTSLNAPNSEVWLEKEKDLVVFAFEPNIHNIRILNEGQTYWPYHIKKDRIGKSFFCLNYALSDKMSEKEKFYCTDNSNSGTSSLFEPKNFNVIDIIDIEVITLDYFFNYFPWEKINYIDQIKIDAQSSDFNIIKGMGDYLAEKVVYLDVETSTGNSYNNLENPKEIRGYLESKGFECLTWDTNATFVNSTYKNILNKINYHILNG